MSHARFSCTASIEPSALRVMVCGPPLTAIGGGPTHIQNVLSSQLKDRFILSHFELGSRGKESPAHDERLTAKLARIVWAPGDFLVRLLGGRSAVVHLNSSLNHRAFWRDLVFLALAKTLRRKVVYQVHGGSLATFCRNRWMWKIADSVFALPDAVILLSTAEERNFGKLSGVKRLRVIPNAIDLQAFGAGERAHSGRVRTLAYLGRLSGEKGLFEAVDAFAMLHEMPLFADLEFLIAGSGPAREELERRIHACGVQDCIRLVGPLFGPAKAEFLQRADVFVFPSYHEGLPYAVLESLAAGTPVVASSVGGIPDVIVDGVHGVLIKPRDAREIVNAIVRLGKSAAELKNMSSTCTRWAREQFGLPRLAAQLGDVYQTVAGNNDEDQRRVEPSTDEGL